MFSKFSCCTSVSATEPQQQHAALSVRAPAPAKHLLRALGDPEPVPSPLIKLDKVSPPTPDLSQEEIAKIQANLLTIEAFVKDLWLQQGQIISEVWAKIEGEAGAARVSKDNKLKEFFEDWMDITSFALTAAAIFPSPLEPVFAAAAVIMATTSYLVTKCGSDTKSITGGNDISASAGSHFEINNAHYYALTQVLDYFRDNTNDCRDYIFKSDKSDKSTTLRFLIDHTFPTGTYYNMWLRLLARTYRRKMVLAELVKQENQFMDLYFIQDSTSNDVEFGHLYQPGAAPQPATGGRGTERTRHLNTDDAGEGAVIWLNVEARHYHDDFPDVCSRGTSNTDLFASWQSATGDFLTRFPSAFIYPWAFTDKLIYTQKYYIVRGFAKLKDDANRPGFNLASDDFLHWLFIDDGAGNIKNVDGVAFRNDVFRTKRAGFNDDVFLHAQQISDGIFWIEPKISCLDYIYGPENSRDINKQWRVYTGDLLLKNLPANPI